MPAITDGDAEGREPASATGAVAARGGDAITGAVERGAGGVGTRGAGLVGGAARAAAGGGTGVGGWGAAGVALRGAGGVAGAVMTTLSLGVWSGLSAIMTSATVSRKTTTAAGIATITQIALSPAGRNDIGSPL